MIWILTLALAMDLSSIRNEQNAGKRSELALEYASTAMDSARDANSAGDIKKMKASLAEVGEAVELSYQSLAGEEHRSTRDYKRAELKTRELLRRIDGLSQLMDVVDRPAADKLHAEVSQIHDELLQGIFARKKSK